MNLNKWDALHFCPDDGFFGDPMPTYHDGVYHVYYCKRYRNGKTGWGHLSTRDLLNWEEHPDPFVPGATTKTGCVLWAEGRFHAYFVVKNEKGWEMRHSSSEDGEQFPMPGDFCFAPDERYENGKLWRDPAVIYDEKAGLYRMVFCAKSAEQPVPNCFGGGIGYAESRDLIQWELKDPLELPEVATSVECPELFPYEDRWVLLYFWHDTRFRTAESPLGPWVRGKVLSPDGFNFLAARRLFDGERQLLFGWISRKDCDCAPYTWGGNMLFPRELTFEKGTPKTCFARELSELFTSKADQKMISCAGQWNQVDGTVEGCAPIGGALACFEALPERFCLKTILRFSTDYMTAGIIFGGKPGHSGRENEILDDGYILYYEPAEGILRLREHYEWDQRPDLAVIPIQTDEPRLVSLEILCNKNIMEISVNQSQTMVYRSFKSLEGALGLLVQDGTCRFENLEILI